MRTFLLQKDFIALPPETRDKLRQALRIGKSGPMEIVDGRMVSDGSTPQDLQAVNIGSLLAFLGPDSGMRADELFDTLFRKVLERLEAAVPEAASELPGEANPGVPVTPDPASRRFCDSCDSRGVRHKKGCPKGVNP